MDGPLCTELLGSLHLLLFVCTVRLKGDDKSKLPCASFIFILTGLCLDLFYHYHWDFLKYIFQTDQQ